MQTIDEMIAVLQAAKAGKAIQTKRAATAEWRDNSNPLWSFYEFDYRIKPEPREWWVAGCFPPACHPCWIAYSSQADALEATRSYPGTVVTHVREVLD